MDFRIQQILLFIISKRMILWNLVILPAAAAATASTGNENIELPPSFTQGESPLVYDYNLLDAVEIPLQDPHTQYVDTSNDDGFAAFGFRYGSDVKIARRQILPEALSREFSILINAKPKTNGFIFAVVNSMETIVELGVRIASENTTSTVLSLFYTDPVIHLTSQIIGNFTVPQFSNKWTKFAFRLTLKNITLFFNCNEMETITINRKPLSLVFDSASTLYLAQAGPIIREQYEVEIVYYYTSVENRIFCNRENSLLNEAKPSSRDSENDFQRV